jgi:hypothetical protein
MLQNDSLTNQMVGRINTAIGYFIFAYNTFNEKKEINKARKTDRKAIKKCSQVNLLTQNVTDKEATSNEINE